MNVVIYARYSSHSQTEQSIEGQLQICYEFAKNNGHIVIGEYIDRAQSGTTDSRAEFQRMIADSDKHTFEGVLVYQLDRFARNRYDSAINKAKLKKNGVRVISARENISCCFSKRMRKVFRKNEKNMLQNCNKKAKRKGRLQRVKKPM